MEKFDGVIFEHSRMRYGVLQCYLPSEEQRSRGVAFHFALSCLNDKNQKIHNLYGLNLVKSGQDWYINSPYKEIDTQNGPKRVGAVLFYPGKSFDEEQFNDYVSFIEEKLIPSLKTALKQFQDRKAYENRVRSVEQSINLDFYKSN